MEKDKPLFKRAIFYFIAMVIVLYLFILAVSMLMSLLHYKLDITGDIVIESVMQTIQHPFNFISKAISEKNPFVLGGSAFIIVYILFLYIKSYRKHKSWEIDKKDTHGSAKWTDRRELLDGGNYQLSNQTSYFSDWGKTLK